VIAVWFITLGDKYQCHIYIYIIIGRKVIQGLTV
jgi:hypothetical protein